MRTYVLYYKYLVALLLFLGVAYTTHQLTQRLSKNTVFFAINNGAFQSDFSDYEVRFERASIALQEEGTSQESFAMRFQQANVSQPKRKGDALWYNNLYQHTNLKFYKKGENLAYDFTLSPGANVKDIQLQVAKNAYLTSAGELAIPTNGGEIRHSAPYSYQEIEGKKVEVASNFVLADATVSFELGEYNAAYAVVIDPMLYFMPTSAIAAFVYDNNNSGTLQNSADCSTTLTRTFNVTDNFTVEDLNVGLNFETTWRGNVRVQLTSPAGTTVTLKDFQNDGDNDLDVLLDDDSTNPIDDESDDNVAAPIYGDARIAAPANPLVTFYGQPATGTWTLTFCNSKELQGGDSNTDRTLTFNSARLSFDNFPAAQDCSVTIKQIGVGACVNTATTNNVSTSLVTVEVETVTEELVLISFNGENKVLDLAQDGCPRYVSFFVNLDTTTIFNKTATVQVIGPGCTPVTQAVLLPAACPQAAACGAAGTLGGTVYNDFDGNGVQGASEFGLKGVAVNVFDNNQNPLCATLTDDNGNWTCTGLTNGTKVRVEFFNFPTGLFPSQTGAQNDGGSVQFSTVGADCDVDFALLSPGEFCQDEPYLILPCYFTGDPLIANSDAANADVLIAVPFDASGNTNQNIYLNKGFEIGSVWGISFNKDSRNVFMSTLLKRHVGWGPDSLSAIYKRNVAALPATTGATSLYVDLDAQFGIDAGNEGALTRDLTGTAGDPSYDADVFSQVGKMGFGDIDITDDYDTLYAVNLMTQSLVLIVNDPSTDTPVSATQIAIPDPGCAAASDWRPWALKYYKGKLYVGGVCSAESTQDDNDLKATVYEFDPTTQVFTTLLNFDLDYPKGSPASFINQESADCRNWNPWTNDFQQFKEPASGVELCYPQPILSDIEFDALGNLALGFIDRAGHQMGWFQYGTDSNVDGTSTFKGNTGGDILRAYNNNGHYVLEKNATAGYTTTLGVNNGQGPCNGEFYYQDAFGSAHEETTLGGLALQPSNNQIIVGAMDATSAFSNGLAWYDNSSGAPTQQYRVFLSNSGSTDGTLGKSAGLGDIELSCTQATQEIGNFVFIDDTRNDVQDGTDIPLEGINVTLYDAAGNVVSATTTDVTGYYYFDTNDGVAPGTQYYVAFGTGGQFTPGTGILTLNSVDYVLLSPNVGFGSRSDLNDSDATIGNVGVVPAPAVGFPVVPVMTNIQGRSNHTFDVGFRSAAEFDLALRKQAAFGGPYAPGSIVSYQITVFNQGTINATNIGVVDYSPADLIFVGIQSGAIATFNSSTANITDNGGGSFTIDALTAGDAVSVTLQFQISPSFAGTSLVNYAEISAASGGTDIDSTPDNIDNNDSGGVPGGVTDDEIFFAPPTDEDDHDPAQIKVAVGAIGNYVWLDEDSNGLQDEGEVGIPNVQVDLKDANGVVIATTYTDSDGKYLFPDLPAASYFVDVVEATLPAGVTQTTVFTNSTDGQPENAAGDGDLGNKDQSISNGYQITLGIGEENLTADFGYNYNPTNDVDNPTGSPTAALGDRVWIDTDSDGVQDVNEIGVAGVQLTLFTAGPDGVFGTGDDVSAATTTTNANGFYLFNGLAPGAYVVMVTSSTGASHNVLLTGASGYNQTGDPDHFAENEANAPAGTANDNKSTRPVILGPGDVFLNVDFGYLPGATAPIGSIGNTIWLDADADGYGPDDSALDAATAAANASFGTNNGLGIDDNNEQPIAGVSVALIKDTNGDGIWDINGVDNILGTADDEPIIGTDVTDANGQYLFSGLPLNDSGDGNNQDADYIVWVNDTDNVLDGLKATYDGDETLFPVTTTAQATGNGNTASAVLGMSDVTLSVISTNNRGQDFGYTPQDHSDEKGLIGDYVWYDTDRDGVQDANEAGIEGVVVELYDLGADEAVGGGDDVLLGTTVTDENGYYYFGGLLIDANGEGYQVKIANSNFNAGEPLVGLENTFDPDNGTTDPDDSMGGAVSLTTASPINLAQDFGYVGDDANTLGSIGNLVWEDLDADGVKDATEAGIAGVTLDLYRDLNGDGQINPGEPRVGTTTTGVNGGYLFDELPLGSYVVDVTDESGLLNGYWHSLGSQTATSNGGNDPVDNSKSDAFAVTIDGTIPNNLNVDFGYYKDPAAVGNYVWNDVNNNGLQDDGETGINGVEVNLVITYPDGTVTTLVTTTVNDASGNAGFYQFPNLLIDEDYNGIGTVGAEPSHTISVNANQTEFTASNLVPTTADVNSNGNDLEDSDDFAGVTAQPIEGNQNTAAVDPATGENVVASYDFGVSAVQLGAIGNYVWIDEDSNGLQDEGEPGIPNVQVNLEDVNGIVIATTYTDSDGKYLFPNLPAGVYFVDVVEATLPTGVTQTTLLTNIVDGADADAIADDGDLGNKDQSDGYQITLDGGEENLTADFGYNYNPTDDVNNPTGSPVAALGDRIWIDSDGDGVQDPNEVGVSGVEVTLMGAGTDGIFGTGDDVTATTTTDENGTYIFDGLTPGAYMVTVTDDAGASHDILDGGQYDQTGDPDHFADVVASAPAGTAGDNKATRPVILGPGDVFLNVDFGYQPAGAQLGSIGNTIWLDADADGNGPSGVNGDAFNGAGNQDDATEQPIAGVSVALILDTNGNGTWEAGEPIIATDVTDANGQYLFEGLPITDGSGTDDYIVWVTDTDNILDGLKPTYDADGGTVPTGSSAPLGNPTATLGISAVSDLTATAVTSQDFGYTPTAQDANEGLIGDYVWYDTNRDGVQDANESGIEGVEVQLRRVFEIINATVDVNGDGVADGNDDGVVGGITIINGRPDINGDGLTNASDDGSIFGVMVINGWVDIDGNNDVTNAQRPNDDGLIGTPIATTTTDENGYYYFGGLPVDANGIGYQVLVVGSNFAANGVLEGLENTYDPDDFTTNPNSEGGLVTLTSASPINLMQDFGYVGDNAGTLGSIGNLVWEDLDADGVKDVTEAGILGVTLDLYRDLNGDGQINPGEPRIGTTTTDANGGYLFDELPLGDYVVDVTDEAGLLNGYWHSLGSQIATSNGGNDPIDNSKVDAFAVTIDGAIPNNLNVDFGYYKDPASVGNYVWEDVNGNGLQDDGETGINGVEVTLMITYPSGTMSTIVTTTVNDASGNPGFYEFPNLLLDEDYNGIGTVGAEPVHTIKVNAAQTVFTNAGLAPTTTNVNSNGNDLEDSDDFTGVVASPVQGNQNTVAVDPVTDEDEVASYDFGVRQVVDLATIIEITSATPAQGYYDEDDAITFKVTVVNQGVQAVSDVTVTNYLPATLENATLVASSLMINGNPVPAGVTITKVGNDYVIDFGTNPANWLQPTDVLMFSFTADITDGTTPGTVITNTVEIETFDTDNDSNTAVPTDVDSTPDATDGNTQGEVSPNLVDDQLTGDGQAGNDEDDHDIAVLAANVVLPVELVRFQAQAQKDYIGLTWTTASELNNERFEIERSEDAKSFKQLGQVKGQGTTLETTDYSFDDKTAIPGVLYYYRLKQVDVDGTFEYSELRVAQLSGDIEELLIYPSPVGSGQKLNVRLYTENARVEFVIADVQNRVAKVFKLDVPQNGWNIFELDVQELPSGSYFLTGSEGQLGGFVKTNE